VNVPACLDWQFKAPVLEALRSTGRTIRRMLLDRGLPNETKEIEMLIILLIVVLVLVFGGGGGYYGYGRWGAGGGAGIGLGTVLLILVVCYFLGVFG